MPRFHIAKYTLGTLAALWIGEGKHRGAGQLLLKGVRSLHKLGNLPFRYSMPRPG